jgi:hypothetical protein
LNAYIDHIATVDGRAKGMLYFGPSLELQSHEHVNILLPYPPKFAYKNCTTMIGLGF